MAGGQEILFDLESSSKNDQHSFNHLMQQVEENLVDKVIWVESLVGISRGRASTLH